MRLVPRHGAALRTHQRWKSLAAFALAGAMVGVLAIVAVFENLDAKFDIRGSVGLERTFEVQTAPPDNVWRRLQAKVPVIDLSKMMTTTAAPGSVQVYPNDYVIRKYDEAGNENWDIGTYGNAPAGNKVGIIVHIIGTLYMLVGLNTVCDIYFCGALDEMVEKWQVKPDVAGATFMAAGGSAPELFTSLIGAVITENDVGFGTIVGSAVFNVLAVIGCCGMSAAEPIQLTWWPLFRDCTFYIFGLTLLAIFAYGESIEVCETVHMHQVTHVMPTPECKTIGGGKIELYEAIVLFACYLLYLVIMVFNEKLERNIQAWLDKVKGRKKDATAVAAVAPGETADAQATELKDAAQANEPAPGPPEHHIGISGGAEASTDAEKPVEAPCPKAKVDHSLDHHLRRVHHKSHIVHHNFHPGEHAATHSKAAAADATVVQVQSPGAADAAGGDVEKAPLADAGGEDEEGEDDILALVLKPEDPKEAVMWVLCLPVYAALYYTVPRPSPKWFMATFGISLLWIAGYSFWLVYCVEMFGNAILGGGDNVTIVMSFTLLAAGTSIPDLVSSMAVARAGEGDMAVSSSIGSNIFDILVGLPIPWVLKIGIVEMAVGGKSDYAVLIKSPYIALYVFLLLFMVGCVIISIHSIGWKLNRPLGAGMGALYLVFLCIVLPVEIVNKGPYL